jgi:hypothetical protein
MLYFLVILSMLFMLSGILLHFALDSCQLCRIQLSLLVSSIIGFFAMFLNIHMVFISGTIGVLASQGPLRPCLMCSPVLCAGLQGVSTPPQPGRWNLWPGCILCTHLLLHQLADRGALQVPLLAPSHLLRTVLGTSSLGLAPAHWLMVGSLEGG